MWAFRKRYPDAEFYPSKHGETPIPDVAGRDVVIVDYCYSPDILLDMKRKAKSIIVLDHHLSAMKDCGFSSDPSILGGEVVFAGTRLSVANVRALIARDAEEELNTDYPDLTGDMLDLAEICHFDMNRSGAGMAWDYCYPGEKRHWLIDYTEDRDLWRFKLPHSKEISAGMMSYPLAFESLDKLDAMGETDGIEMLWNEGSAILRADQTKIETIAKKARIMEVAGYMVPVVNSSCLQSELGNFLCQGKSFAVIWHEIENGDRVYSLRSDKNGVDVSVVAKEMGGGGHRAASSFKKKVGETL
jgi:uncharacterized protein (DUF433 family)